MQELVVHGRHSGGKWSFICEAGCIFEAICNVEIFISVVLDQFCCIVVKPGKLLLQIRQGCMRWSII